jgi:protein ImuB
MSVRSWGGPWPSDEHWWDPVLRRRRARIQVLLEDGRAYLLALEQGRWCLEGRYD